MKRLFKYIAIALLVGNAGACFGQYDLKWKIGQSETLVYRFISTIENSKQTDFQFDFDTKSILAHLIDRESIDSLEANFSSLKEQKLENFNQLEKILTLSKRDNGDIDIKIIHFTNSGESRKKAKKLEKNTLFYNAEGVKFRGIIDSLGNNKSFYLSENDRLNIALYCTLPQKQVTVGESWFIKYTPFRANYLFYVKNYSKNNKVTLTQIDTIDHELIATIKYDNSHSITGLMYYNTRNEAPTDYYSFYKAKALFNVTTGRWVYVKGIFGFSSTGIMTQNTIQTVELIPTQKWNRIVKKYE